MKGKLTKILIPAIILVIAIVIESICAARQNSHSIYIDEKMSYFSEFNVVGDEVQIVCCVTICNTYDTEKTVSIRGDFSDEVENGLLTDGLLYSVDSDGLKSEYTLPPKEKQSFYVTFVGDFAGTEQMTSRLLPPIIIEEAS